MKKLFQENTLLWLALALALFGSLTHVAWGFSTLEQGNMILGYIQAVAVDVGLFAIAVGIQRARFEQRSTRTLWGGVFFFSGISTYANLLHGLAFSSRLDLPGWEWLVFLRPFLLSAVLPILVVYLAEVAAGRLGRRKDNYYTNRRELDIPTPILASVFLKRWYNDHKREPLAPEMVRHFKHVTGQAIDIDQAEQFILDWRSEAGVTGRRPSTPTPGVVAVGSVNGRG